MKDSLKRMMYRSNFQMHKTLCWHCKNAVPEGKYGCSWSRDFKPVKGWNVLPPLSRVKGSYRVIECPLFIRERREP